MSESLQQAVSTHISQTHNSVPA